MAEQAYVAPAPLIGGGRVLPSPAAFYLTGEDRLRLIATNSRVGVRVALHWRTALPNGITIPNSQSFTPTSDRFASFIDYELGTGALLNVTAFVASGNKYIGETFVTVQLVRGIGNAAIVLGTLLAGYITITQALGWPGSPIQSSTSTEPLLRLVSGTTPAAGLEWSEAVPTGARWELISVSALLQTDAGGAPRIPVLRIRDAGRVFSAAPNPSTQGASTLARWSWSANVPNAFDTGIEVFQSAIPSPAILLESQFFESITLNLDPGDQWSGLAYMVREWLEVT